MRVIVHLSDLHFGTTDPRLVSALAREVAGLGSDLVAVSGDLTQRARGWQFRAARRFLDDLRLPLVVVPGNHDVPLYNVAARFVAPLGGFRTHITRDLVPRHVDDEIAVLGANTTRSITIKDGGWREADVEVMSRDLRALPSELIKIVVCHHPFDAPAGSIGRFTRPMPAANAMRRLMLAGADVFLTGHLHRGYAGGTAHRYPAEDEAAIVVEAGTATSTRTRGEPNSFNVLRIGRGDVLVERCEWKPDDDRFVRAASQRFTRGDRGWAAAW